MVASSSGPESEARSHPRYVIRKPVSYYYGGKRFLTLTLNLGLGGMKVETRHYLPENEQLDIHMDLWPNSIWTKGRTVYSRLLSESRYVSGLQFIEVPEQDQSSLKDYLATLNVWPKPQGMLFANERMDAGIDLLDITKLRHTDEEIKKLNENLEFRVLKRIEQLEALNKELEAFCYSVSHDLRTPLLVIEGLSRNLLEKYSNCLDAKGQHFLSIIRSTTQKMVKLIEDLLTFSHLERQRLKPSDIDMCELAKAVFEELRLNNPGQPLLLKIKTLPQSRGDQAIIRQVLVNLLSNAIKFTRLEESAVIEVGCIAKENLNIYYVKDNGIGFDMQYADKLFGAFQRFHTEGEFKGSGLGLAIVKRIINRHGGQVWAEGKVNEGSTFYFTLPK
ncbi:MAG: ATP-binding protein [Thermodesulfobacteriota bacterium]|nr:ATP-binding protein [Thermodesulfobacteriota bacterium]